MKKALSVCPKVREPKPEEIDWVTDFIENPYFLRPKFSPSGRALPETIASWDVEDALKRGKVKGWRTPSEGREIRCRRSKENFQWLREGKWKPKEEKLSYLTVSCDDLPEEAVTLPGRIRDRSLERGNFFKTAKGDPIFGPKTEEEAVEDQKIEDSLDQWCQRWAEQVRSYCAQPPMNKEKKVWSPRWPSDEPDPSEGVKIRIESEFEDSLFFQPFRFLRKEWIWEDFCFLADLMAKGAPWEATMAGSKWVQGDGRRPLQNQVITIRQASQKNQEKHEKWIKDADQRWFDSYVELGFPGNGHAWGKPTISTSSGVEQPTEDLESYLIVVHMPEELEERLIRIPKNSGWIYFKQLMDNLIGKRYGLQGFCTRSESIRGILMRTNQAQDKLFVSIGFTERRDECSQYRKPLKKK
jgi:hypothetical protein